MCDTLEASTTHKVDKMTNKEVSQKIDQLVFNATTRMRELNQSEVIFTEDEASNLAHLFDIGYKKQAQERADKISVKVEQDWNNESTTYIFEDGSSIVSSGSEFRVATNLELNGIA